MLLLPCPCIVSSSWVLNTKLWIADSHETPISELDLRRQICMIICNSELWRSNFSSYHFWFLFLGWGKTESFDTAVTRRPKLTHYVNNWKNSSLGELPLWQWQLTSFMFFYFYGLPSSASVNNDGKYVGFWVFSRFCCNHFPLARSLWCCSKCFVCIVKGKW
jgi:hypothetical protein